MQGSEPLSVEEKRRLAAQAPSHEEFAKLLADAHKQSSGLADEIKKQLAVAEKEKRREFARGQRKQDDSELAEVASGMSEGTIEAGTASSRLSTLAKRYPDNKAIAYEIARSHLLWEAAHRDREKEERAFESRIRARRELLLAYLGDAGLWKERYSDAVSYPRLAEIGTTTEVAARLSPEHTEDELWFALLAHVASTTESKEYFIGLRQFVKQTDDLRAQLDLEIEKSRLNPDWYLVKNYLYVAERPNVPRDVKIDALYEAALAYHKHGKRHDAERTLRTILQIDPQHYNAQFMLAIALIRLERRDAAVAAFERATRLDARRTDAYTYLARLHTESGAHDLAEATMQRALEQGAPAGDLWYQYGRLHSAASNHARALDAFRHAVSASPDNPRIRLRMSSTAIELGEYETAVTAMGAVVEQGWDAARYRVSLGAAYERAGDSARATDAYRRALTSQTADETTWRQITDAIVGDWADLEATAAKDHLTRLRGLSIDQERSWPYVVEEGALSYAAGDVDAATAFFIEAYTLAGPGSAALHERLTDLFEVHRGDRDVVVDAVVNEHPGALGLIDYQKAARSADAQAAYKKLGVLERFERAQATFSYLRASGYIKSPIRTFGGGSGYAGLRAAGTSTRLDMAQYMQDSQQSLGAAGLYWK